MKKDRGNREWLNDYMSIKQVNPNNPFTVPEGYFDSLDERILSKIRLEELKKSMPESGFSVPENYFEDLTTNIQARINIEEALDIEATGFTVPKGYFDELTNNIQSRITIEETLSKEDTGFTVPEGYFENLSEQIQSRIFVQEALNKQPEGFTIPSNYFDRLTDNILDQTTRQAKEKPRGAVIRKLFMSGAFKYATAACLVLVIGGTLLLNRNNPQNEHKNSFLHKSLSVISVDDIQNYLQLHTDASDQSALMEESKQVDANNLSKDLQNALDSTSQ
jgi:hypothetical protein